MWPARPAPSSAFSGIRTAAPASTSPCAFAVWWSPVAAAKGIRIAGRPITLMSATDEAPERLMTSCASDRRRGMSGKNGAISARTPAAA